MEQQDKTDSQRLEALEKSIEDLRGFDTRISWIVGIVLFAASVWGFFNLWQPVLTPLVLRLTTWSALPGLLAASPGRGRGVGASVEPG